MIRERRLRALVPLCLGALLAACSTPSVEVRSQPACPPSLAQWPRDFQARVADGLKTLPPDANGAAVRVAIRQLLNMRSELRAAGCAERPALPSAKPGETQ